MGKQSDLRSHNHIRVSVITPAVHLANPAKNADSHLQLIKKAYEEGAMYVLGPELGLTGYTLGDLFHQQLVSEQALAALADLLKKTQKLNLLISVGMPLVVNHSLYNVAVTFHQGKLLAITPKTYPPEYKEFYELRHFARSVEANLDSVTILGQQVPFGNDILVTSLAHPDFTLHTEVCEDGWVPLTPSSFAALAGATVLANLSASNITVGKADYRASLVKSLSARNLAAYLYSASGFGESTSDLAWDGDSYIASRGVILNHGQRFSLQPSFIISDINLDQLVHDRLTQSSFHQNAADNKHHFRHVSFDGQLGTSEKEVFKDLLVPPQKHPFVPSQPKNLKKRTHEVFMIQAYSLAQRLNYLPQDLKKLYLGLSGGLDSTLSLLVAIKAFQLLSLPLSDIHAITMPGFGTTSRTKNNAQLLAQKVGVSLDTIDIKDISALALKKVGYNSKIDQESIAFENAQAWARMYTLFLSSAQHRGLVLGTGDLTELLLGWCTIFADHASHYNVNAGVPKTLVKHQIIFASEHLYSDQPAIQKILADIVATPISPELKSAQKDTISQETEKIIGPYELHDFFAYHLLRFGTKPSTVFYLAHQAFKDSYSPSEIKKWLKLFITRFFANQFKRNVLPDGPKVGLLAVSPRGDLRLPSDASDNLWLQDLDQNALPQK